MPGSSGTCHNTAAEYPSFRFFKGGVSAVLQALPVGQAFLWMPVSASGVNVTSGGALLKSTVDVPPFHVPHSPVGGMPVLLCTSCVPFPVGCCQSPARQFGSLAAQVGLNVISVTKSNGRI